MAAAAALDPAHQLEEEPPLVGEHGFAAGVAFEQAAAQRHVVGRDEQQPAGEGAVAPRAADLLVVGLDGARGREVHDRAHVRPVDAHPEGVGGDHDLGGALEERALRLFPRLRPQAGVIDAGAPPAPSAAARPPLPRPRRVGAYTMATPRALPGPPSASASTASTCACRSSAPSTSAARSFRFGRAKPLTCWGVSAGRPRRLRISSRTTGVAVAVQASTRALGRSARSPPISRYSGRKSWPHSLMQCASSMATSGISHVAQQAAEARRTRAARGRRRPASTRPAAMRAMRRRTSFPSRVEASIVAGTPRAFSACTWSFISATSGEITSVVPRKQHRRKLVAEALAAAGGRDEEQAARGQQRLHGFALAGAERRVARGGAGRRRCRGARHPLRLHLLLELRPAA